MKKVIIILLACLFATCALAADQSVLISSKTTFNGHPVTPGEYKISYQVKGSNVDVKLIQAGKTVATATGQLVETKETSRYDSVVNQINPDGTQTVIEIQTANKKNVIRLNTDNTAVGK